MQRAYSQLTIKAVNEDQRTIEGVATTPSPDRMGDIVEPTGAVFKLPIPLLYQHDSSQPIGHVEAAKVSKDGITITARLVKFSDAINSMFSRCRFSSATTASEISGSTLRRLPPADRGGTVGPELGGISGSWLVMV